MRDSVIIKHWITMLNDNRPSWTKTVTCIPDKNLQHEHLITSEMASIEVANHKLVNCKFVL